MDAEHIIYDYPKVPAPRRQQPFALPGLNVQDDCQKFRLGDQFELARNVQVMSDQAHTEIPAYVPHYEATGSAREEENHHEAVPQPDSPISTFQGDEEKRELGNIEEGTLCPTAGPEIPQKPDVAKVSKKLSIWPSQIEADKDLQVAYDEGSLASTPVERALKGNYKTKSTASKALQQTFDIPINTYNSISEQTHQQQGKSWHHSLFSCADPTTCITALFCPCIIYSRTQYRLNRKTTHQDPTNMLGYRSINGACVTWGLLCGINSILTAIQKSRIRRAYEMETGSGNLFSDCLQSCCCCCCCVLARNEKEIRFREEQIHGRTKTTTTVPTTMERSDVFGAKFEVYESPGSMIFSPPPPPASMKAAR